MLGLSAAFGAVALSGLDEAAWAASCAPRKATTTASGSAYKWVTAPFGAGGFVDGFVYHPKEKGLLYSRTDIGGAYRFDAANKRWAPLLDQLGNAENEFMGVLAIALDPNDANKIYLACGEYLPSWAHDGAVLRSGDRGATWQTTPLAGVKLGGNSDGRGAGERLQVDPNKNSILFLGTNQNGLYKSVDQGLSFSPVTSFPAKNVTMVLIDGRSAKAGAGSQTIYVGCGEGNGGLYKSTDGGASFTSIPELQGFFPQRAAIDSSGAIYVTLSNGLTPAGGTGGALYKYDATKKIWSNISPMKPGGSNPSFGYCGVDVAANRAGTVIVSTMNRWATRDDVYLSRDSGATWKAIGAQARHNPGKYQWLVNYMGGQDTMGHWIADVKIDPFDANGAVYGTGYGLWMTADLGNIDNGGTVHFDFVVDNFEETATIAMVSPPACTALLVAMGDVSGSGYTDLAQTPKSVLFAPSNQSNQSVDYAEASPAIVVRTSDQAQTSGFYSTDGGMTWVAFPSSPRTNQNSGGTAGKIAVSAKGKGLLWVPDKEAAYYSMDMGKTWKQSGGWPSARDVSLVGVADRAVDGVFYVHDRSANTILISANYGATFTPLIQGLPKVEGWRSAQLIAAPGRSGELWLALPAGLYHRVNNQSTMTAVANVNEAWQVALGKAATGKPYQTLYLWGRVGGKEGIWRSDDLGANWARINDDKHRFGALRAMAADPVEYGTVYLAPHGRGVIVGRPL
jgi:hypothetical protein